VKRRPPDGSALLRWYPASWRHRYGDELVALMADTLNGEDPSPKLRISIAWAGLRERVREAGLLGTTKPAAERIFAGAIAVLCAWMAFLLAGGRFAKYSEHFEQAVPRTSRVISVDAYNTVAAAAVLGGVLVLIGAVVALPSFVRFLRSGGWPSVRRHFRRALGISAVTGLALAGLAPEAHSLTPAQRNGGSFIYSVAFGAIVVLVSTSLVLWTVVAVAATRRLELTRRVLTTEIAMAALVSGTMVVMTGATATWWATVASSAPWFLQSTRSGSTASVFEPQLAATMSLMLVATVAALVGMRRAARSWREFRAG